MYNKKKNIWESLVKMEGKNEEEEILGIIMLNSLTIVVFIWEIVPTFFVIYESK